MTASVDPHITLVHPMEYTDLDLLITRARSIAAATSAFTLSAADFVTDGDEVQNGVFAEFFVPSDSWDHFRRGLLTPPFTPIDAQPHLTIVRPEPRGSGPKRGPNYAPSLPAVTSPPANSP